MEDKNIGRCFVKALIISFLLIFAMVNAYYAFQNPAPAKINDDAETLNLIDFDAEHINFDTEPIRATTWQDFIKLANVAGTH